MTPVHLVVLAAGLGTRMKSALPKVLHEVAGVPLIEHVLRSTDALEPQSITVVVGHRADAVRSALAGRPLVRFALQEPQLGTGHALLQAEPALSGAQGTLILLSGDVPLLRPATLDALRRHHTAAEAVATLLTAVVDDPAGYGRVVRRDGRIAAVVEHKDATADERRIAEINSGIYAFALEPLFGALREIGSSNAQGEYYLPDLVTIYRARGQRVETMTVTDPLEILGVNSRKELAIVEDVVKTSRNDALMAAGVTLVDPATAYIGPDVVIEADVTIHPNVHLEGRTRIGARCQIQSSVRIVNSTIGEGSLVNNFCVIADSTIGAGARIGPFAHIRPDSTVGDEVHIGNFVELKKTVIGRGSKANHHAYLGDASIGQRVNVGAGTITCNYDGTAKHRTTIEDDAFIGSDTQLIAPVRVGRGAYVGAGSSITDDVPDGALAIARGRQVIKPGWAGERKKTASD